jgi:hypothetical protein
VIRGLADIPAWIGAVSTVGTLTTGLILFANVISDRRREYAKLVAVWTDVGKVDKGSPRPTSVKNLKLGTIIGPMPGPIDINVRIENSGEVFVDGKPLGWPGEENFGFRLNLKNNSLQPIYACQLSAHLDEKVLPQGRYPILYDNLQVELGIVAPAIEVSHSLLIGTPIDQTRFPEALVQALTFRLQFTDAARRRWVPGRIRTAKATSSLGEFA